MTTEIPADTIKRCMEVSVTFSVHPVTVEQILRAAGWPELVTELRETREFLYHNCEFMDEIIARIDAILAKAEGKCPKS